MSDEVDHQSNNRFEVDDDEELLNQCNTPVAIPPPPLSIVRSSSEDGGQRLIIIEIVSENFKSYGGIRRLGPFHKNFTGIIGPNGSGKSNVIDSMLFVFGYRASKVRSKKLSQLIHQSELVPRAESCTVSVRFQKIFDHGSEIDGYDVVPDSEFVVSRQAYRDNSSCYRINDVRASYKDVTALLRQHGVDLDHNRFLILQGEVEQIALMKPKAPTEHEDGFLEYLEDIIGSSRFKQPLELLASRMERLNDLRLEKLSRVKAVEKEKDELEGVRNEAVGYLRLVNRTTRLKNALYQLNAASERETGDQLAQHLASTREEDEVITGQLKQQLALQATTRADRDRLSDEFTRVQSAFRDAKARFTDFEAEDSRLRDECSHVKANGRKLAKSLEAERGKLDGLKAVPGEADGRRKELTDQLKQLEGKKTKQEELFEETVKNLESETAPLRSKVETAQSALGPLQDEHNQAASKLALERQQFECLMQGRRREQDRLEAAQRAAGDTRERLQQADQQLQSAQSSIDGLVKGLKRAQSDLDQVKGKEAGLTSELGELRSKLAESKSACQFDKSRNRILAALLDASRSGAIKGVIGRLGDLGAIPPAYDTAVSTACPSLDHIVTDTMDSAQQAVAYLKQHRLGQATFIGLDKMQQWARKASQPFSCPSNPPNSVHRLFDLVQTDNDAVKPAFYFAMRDTLVTDNLDGATKIAFYGRQRFRVVTLQGQLIETSGAMSGGGNRPLSGRMLTSLQEVKRRRTSAMPSQSDGGRDSLDQAIPRLEQRVQQTTSQLTAMRDSRFRLEEASTRLQRELDETRKTIKRSETEAKHLKAEIASRDAEASQVGKRLESIGPSKAEQTKREQAIGKLEQVEQSVKQKVDKKVANLDQLKSQLADVGSARLAAVRSRLEAIEQHVKETNEQLTKLDVTEKTAVRNLAKAEARIKAMEADLEAAKAKLEETNEKIKILEDQAKACMQEYQAFQAQMETLQKDRDELGVKLADVDKCLACLEKSQSQLKLTLSQLESDLAASQAKVKSWEREIRSLRLHQLDALMVDGDEEHGDGDTTIGHDAVASSSSQGEGASKKPVGGLPRYTPDELKELSIDRDELKQLQDKVAGMAPNMAAIEEYRIKSEMYLTRVAELNRVSDALLSQRKQLEEAKSKRLSDFMDGFHEITGKLKEMYQMITQGGDAELELIDSLDPFSEGIVFSVRPPKKSWKNIANLSGGEKTLSSLALVFALHHYKPTPLYVMDEIDAALDFKNVSIVANYLKERTRDAQFIVISLRNDMFELSDRLVGIYKTFNITKTITLDPAPLKERLNNVLCRLATAHGRQAELIDNRTVVQSQQPPAQPPSTQSQPQSVIDLTQETAPIKPEESSVLN